MNFEQKKNTKAIAWTVGIHSLIIIASIYIYLYEGPAYGAPQDLGMEVNLGTSENGFGTDQPENMDDPAAANAATTSNAASASNSNDKEINTTDDNDAPSVNINHPKPANKPNKLPANNTPNRRSANNNNANATVTTPAQSPRYVYPGATGKGGNGAQQNKPGANEGIGTGNGDMGVQGGTVGASNYTGTPGSGGGSPFMRVSIAGRKLDERPDPRAEFKEGGQVVINVTVNREGVIKESRVKRAANATIRAIALQKLKNVRFNKDPKAPPEQTGDITFDFRATRK